MAGRQLTDTKSQTAFTAKWRQLSGSAPLLKCVHVLYYNCSPSQAQRKVARAMAKKIKTLLVHTVSNTLRSARPIQSEAVTDITSAGEANIRKLGGWALVKNRKLHINKAHKAVKEGHVDDMSDLAINILKSMEISYSVLVDVTKKPDSLRAVERSQGVNRGLTHITDQAFQFCLLLECKRNAFQTSENLCHYQTLILVETVERMKSDAELWGKWQCMIRVPEKAPPTITLFSSAVNEKLNFIAQTKMTAAVAKVSLMLFKIKIVSYLQVTNNGYRKYLPDQVFTREKQLAHRVEVLTEPGAKEPDVKRKNMTRSKRKVVTQARFLEGANSLEIDMEVEEACQVLGIIICAAEHGKLQCTTCLIWAHITCLHISAKQLNQLKSFPYRCTKCSSKW